MRSSRARGFSCLGVFEFRPHSSSHTFHSQAPTIPEIAHGTGHHRDTEPSYAALLELHDSVFHRLKKPIRGLRHRMQPPLGNATALGARGTDIYKWGSLCISSHRYLSYEFPTVLCQGPFNIFIRHICLTTNVSSYSSSEKSRGRSHAGNPPYVTIAQLVYSYHLDPYVPATQHH